MTTSDSIGPIEVTPDYMFRPRFSSQWTVGQVMAVRGNSWLVHYRKPGYSTLSGIQWFPPRRRVERKS